MFYMVNILRVYNLEDFGGDVCNTYSTSSRGHTTMYCIVLLSYDSKIPSISITIVPNFYR